MKHKKGTFQTVFSFAGQCRWKMIFAVLFAVCSVAGGLLPYLGVYRIILIFFEGEPAMEGIMPWIGLCAAGYLAKQVFHALSTSFSHISAYHILENIRLALSDASWKRACKNSGRVEEHHHGPGGNHRTAIGAYDPGRNLKSPSPGLRLLLSACDECQDSACGIGLCASWGFGIWDHDEKLQFPV